MNNQPTPRENNLQLNILQTEFNISKVEKYPASKESQPISIKEEYKTILLTTAHQYLQ